MKKQWTKWVLFTKDGDPLWASISPTKENCEIFIGQGLGDTARCVTITLDKEAT